MIKPFAFAAISCLTIGAMSSCSEEAKKQAAAESAAETAVDAVEDYAKLMESIKDEDSAKKAIDKMDGLADKFVKIAEKSKRADGKLPSPEEQAKLQEKMKPAQERLNAAMTAAMPIISSKPELVQAFQAKSMALAEKMMAALK